MLRWPFARKRGLLVERIDPQSAYALWAPHYPPRPHNRLMEVEHATVIELLPDLRGRIALDAGCGSGRYSRELEARGATAIGMDLSASMLNNARESTTRLVRADLRGLPLGSTSVDVVVCGLALGDVADLELALQEISRVLRQGGRVIYSVVHPAGEAAGWSRSFEVEGRHVAIDSHWHSLARHRDALGAAGLTIEQWREPVLAERPDQRAVLVVRARR